MSDKDEKKITNEQDSAKDNSSSSKKEPEKITLVNNESVHNQPADINQNVGSFGDDISDPSKETKKEEAEQLDVTDKSKQYLNIREKDVAINFEKFSKTKKEKTYKPGSSKFSIQLDAWLHNKRSCLTIWMILLAIIIVLLALSITLVIIVTLESKSNDGWWNFDWMKNLAIANSVFCYLIIGLTVIPLIYLLITVLVGIRDTYRSRKFHYFMWICYLIAFVFLIAVLCMSGVCISHNNAFTPAS